MAGNRKPKRNPTKVNAVRAAVRATLPNPAVRFFNHGSTLAELHVAALTSLNKIIDSTGNFKDWMNVLYRIYIGSVAVERHFKQDPDVNHAMNQAAMAIQIVKLRTLLTGEFGILIRELDSVTQALALTDQACRMMTVVEIRKVYNTVDDYFNTLDSHNASHIADINDREAMVETLIKEHLEVRHIPVNDGIEDVEFNEIKEAA